MITIEKNKPLASYTTLGIAAAAEYFAVVRSKADVIEAIGWAKANQRPIFVLGGGSNLLVAKKVRGLMLKNEIRGRQIVQENKGTVVIEARSGENWSKFVDYTVSKGWYGLENLSLVYGTVGAAPIQNIGAYGAELKDCFSALVAIDLKTGRERRFSAAECRFGYRDSVFKGRLKGRYFIFSVSFILKKKASLRLDYGSIREVLAAQGITKPTLRQVAETVKSIRRHKLPDPATQPNAGSFFKNIEVSAVRYRRLQSQYPGMPGWPAGDGRVKIPSAWLIEASGFKGKRFGPVGMHDRQALVMVNHDGATPAQALGLSRRIKIAVRKRFGLDLQEEINII